MSLLAKNRNYRLLFSASAISNLGDGVSALAFPWLASLITRDPFMIATVAFATRLPWLLFTLPAGVITDRGDRQRLMVMADLLRLLLTAGVVALIVSLPDLPPPSGAGWYILALSGLAFLLGSAEVVRDNAAQTALPSVVESNDLERANGQMWSIEQIMGSFVGPPLAGFLIAYAVPAPFALDAITFALAAWVVWLITVPPRRAPVKRSLYEEAKEGFVWLWQHPKLLRLAVMLGFSNMLSIMALTILVLFSQEILNLSGFGHGLLLTAGAAGGVVGGIVCPAIAQRLGAERSLHMVLLLFPTMFVVIYLTSNVWVVAIALFIEMFAALLWNVVTVSYRQRLIPDDLLGRVNSIYRFFGWGLMPVGALLAGAVVALAEPSLGRELALRLPYALAGGVAIMLAVYGFARLRL
ncbi:MFS transporter [Amylibacter sp. IMCC11727]|uniref:MFS transporter n=1 Tax=Amylibacter sp. IMCC11727 TaxID=3039851 RepID=UPI00244E5106|nr:MFS transporter [Amylibacter sp. IMCC11727]WGI22326.1 MFS transporter [Amylibacter sp. IMCC11727]